MDVKRGRNRTTQTQPITQVTNPVIGNFYYVECAIVIRDEKPNYIPIIGHAHKDNEFGVNYVHYHIDGRFYVPLYFVKNGRTNNIVNTEDVREYSDKFKGTVFKRRKLVRLETGINEPDRLRFYKWHEKGKKDYNNWYDSMIGKECAKIGVCPHRGIKMIDMGDKFVCPLHNLHVDKNTNKVIYPVGTQTFLNEEQGIF